MTSPISSVIIMPAQTTTTWIDHGGTLRTFPLISDETGDLNGDYEFALPGTILVPRVHLRSRRQYGGCSPGWRAGMVLARLSCLLRLSQLQVPAPPTIFVDNGTFGLTLQFYRQMPLTKL
ncbi:MAG: hypothetical protein U0X39_04465 [Bacteroidales bacterium]